MIKIKCLTATVQTIVYMHGREQNYINSKSNSKTSKPDRLTLTAEMKGGRVVAMADDGLTRLVLDYNRRRKSVLQKTRTGFH